MAVTIEIPQDLTYSSDETIAQVCSNPGFGVHFTDHMAVIDWTHESGWHNARIVDFGPQALTPASAVFHYAQSVFEGLKAYRRADGSVWTFRSERNGARLGLSAERLALPVLPVDDFVTAVETLIRVDARWVPHQREQSLYLRPFEMGQEDYLGVRPAKKVQFAIIASPVGAYFSGGITPVKIWVETERARVANGGTGEAKCGGNYAASLMSEQIAIAHGCSQVLFVDNAEHRWIEELGGMNFMMITAQGELVTPILNGNILRGVTRNSILTIAPELGLTPIQRPIELAEVLDGISCGYVKELLACGTAAVITPIGSLVRGDEEYRLDSNFETTLALRQRLLGIQYGTEPDLYGWTKQVVPPAEGVGQ